MAQHSFALQRLLYDPLFEGDIVANEPMSRHTTYRIGGPAHFFVRVDTLTSLSQTCSVCEESGIPWVVIGRGSNLLVADEGFAGAVIILGRDFRTLKVDDGCHRFIAGAGVLLSAVVQKAFQESLAGLEFAVGTPGTMGGAIRMNAGSAKEWLGALVYTVTTFSTKKGLVKYRGSDIAWGYRSSSIPAQEVVVECELSMEPSDPVFIHAKMEASLKRRKSSQPLDEPSCGSVFKNPAAESAGALIDRLGLKGARIGGACISPKHANFIVNDGKATAEDVRRLMAMVQMRVKEAYGIELTPEVRFLGFAPADGE